MTAVRGLEQHAAQGINLLYFLPAACAALPAHFKNRYVNLRAVVPAVCAGLVTGAWSAWLSAGMELEPLRRCFGLFLVIIGLSELFHGKGNSG
jgi:uncharacterized membrane protein YfcA